MTRIDRERLARVAQGYTNDDPIIRDARDWLLDAFAHDEETEEYIEAMSVFQVILVVEAHFGGGWAGFVETGKFFKNRC